MSLQGALVVSHPGGTILFHKKLTAGFGLGTDRPWEPWNLAALLSAVQLYSSNLSSEWRQQQQQPEGTDSENIGACTAAAVSSTSTSASMSCFTFQRSTIHFWHHHTPPKSGTMTVVFFQGKPSQHHQRLSRTISEAFTKHCQQQEEEASASGITSDNTYQAMSKPVRGFSSPFRHVLLEHLDYLVEQASSLFSVTATPPQWLHIIVQRPAQPSDPVQPTKDSVSRPPLALASGSSVLTEAPPVPDSSKGTRPKRRFFSFLRGKKKKSEQNKKSDVVTTEATNAIAATTATDPEATKGPPIKSTSSAISRPVVHMYTCRDAGGDPRPILKRVKDEEAVETSESMLVVQAVENDANATVTSSTAITCLGLNLCVEMISTSKYVPVARVRSFLVTTTFPWTHEQPPMEKELQMIARLHLHAAIVYIRSRR